MIRKKIYALILVGLVIVYSFFEFSYAQLKVPVMDSSVIAGVGKINEILGIMNKFLFENIQKINENLQLILKSQVEDKLTKVFSDALQEKAYVEYALELDKIIEENRIKGPEDIEADIKEAIEAGIISALNKFDTLPCIPPYLDYYEEIYDYTLGIIVSLTEVDFSEMVDEAVNNIPICEPSLFAPLSLIGKTINTERNVFARILRPFNITLLAQANPSANGGDEELPSFEITPAFQAMENSSRISELKRAIADLIYTEVNAKVTERTFELSKVRPIEDCREYAFVEGGEDDGHMVCLDYETLIDLKSLDNSLKNTNPLMRHTQDIYLYSTILSTQNLLWKLGLTTSTLITPNDLVGGLNLDNETALKTMIDLICSTFALGDTNLADTQQNSKTYAYAQCLSNFQKKAGLLVQTEKKEVEELEKSASTTQKEAERLASIAESLANEARNAQNPQNLKKCKGAEKDLTLLSLELGNIASIYAAGKNNLSQELIELNNLFLTIQKSSNEINHLMDKINKINLEVLGAADKILQGFGSFLNALSSFFNINISEVLTELNKIQQSLNKFKADYEKIKQETFGELSKIFQTMNSVLSTTTQSIAEIYQIKQERFQKKKEKNDPFSGITRSKILNDMYLLDKARKRVEAYKSYIAKNCTTSPQSSGVSLRNKNKLTKVEVAIVKPKEKKWSLNFLNVFNIFKWKSFEITFQK